jgi:hypothetical protein
MKFIKLLILLSVMHFSSALGAEIIPGLYSPGMPRQYEYNEQPGYTDTVRVSDLFIRGSGVKAAVLSRSGDGLVSVLIFFGSTEKKADGVCPADTCIFVFREAESSRSGGKILSPEPYAPNADRRTNEPLLIRGLSGLIPGTRSFNLVAIPNYAYTVDTGMNGKMVYRRNIQLYSGSFDLKEPRPYISILRTVRETSAADPSGKNKPVMIAKGSCTAVIEEGLENDLCDIFDDRGVPARVLIPRLDLIKGERTGVIASTEEFCLEAVTELSDDEWFSVNAVIVKDRKKNRVIQLIEPQGIETRSPPKDSIRMVDANFDGYPDISVLANDGGAGPNNSYNFYLYNPETRKFEFDEDLSELTQTEIDPVRKEIRSAWRNGAAEHGYESYRFSGGKLELVERIIETYHYDDETGKTFLKTSIRRLLNGRYVDTSEEKEAAGD